jgi:hypothetical protein
MPAENPIIDVPNNVTPMPGAAQPQPLPAPIPAGLSFNIEGMLRSPITWMVAGAVAMVFVMRWMKKP